MAIHLILKNKKSFNVFVYNLLTMTGYKGLDPEVSIKGLAPGVEGSGAGELYPTTRQFTVGLNLLF